MLDNIFIMLLRNFQQHLFYFHKMRPWNKMICTWQYFNLQAFYIRQFLLCIIDVANGNKIVLVAMHDPHRTKNFIKIFFQYLQIFF